MCFYPLKKNSPRRCDSCLPPSPRLLDSYTSPSHTSISFTPKVDIADVTSLPMGDSPDLILAPATPEEHLTTLKLSSVTWKGLLDTETYIALEQYMANQSLTRDNITCWILVDKSQCKEKRTILSACEIYQKRTLLAHDGQVKDTSTQFVSHVHTPPEFRRRGYATRMMGELARKHDMQEGNLFSMLWSAIGKNFYARFGWQPFLSSHLALPPRAWDELPNHDTGKSRIKDMYADDVKKHMCSDAVMAKLREQMASENSANAKVAVLPDFDHFAWHWSREDFFVQKQLPDRSPPVIKGAGDDDVRVYCTWTRYFDENPGFYILRWVYDDPKSSDDEKILVQAIATLLRRAQQESHEWGVGNVVVWNPPPLVHKAATVIDPELQIVHRDRDICSLRWTGDQHGLSKDVEWVLNERYAWC